MPLISGVRRTKHNNFAAYKRRSRLNPRTVPLMGGLGIYICAGLAILYDE